MSEEKPHLFTVDEVNTLIPKLELIMGQMQRCGFELRRQIEDHTRGLEKGADELEVSELLDRRPELRGVVQELEQLLAEIESCGGHFKGLDLGLVDFPSEVDGELVLLCWQFGEKEVTHFHDFEDGFAGRKPIRGQRRSPYLQ